MAAFSLGSIFGSAFTSLPETVRQFVRDEVAHLGRGIAPSVSTLQKFLEKVEKKRIEALHKKKSPNEANTVDQEEFGEAKKLVESYWTKNPIVKLWRFITKILLSSSREKTHLQELAEMDKLAGMYESGNFANEAVSFYIKKVNKVIGQVSSKGNIFKRIASLFSKKVKNKFEESELMGAYINSLTSWIKALDTNTERDRVILQGYKDELYYLYEYGTSKLPESMRTQIAEAFNSKLSDDEKIDETSYKAPPSIYEYMKNRGSSNNDSLPNLNDYRNTGANYQGGGSAARLAA